jgi:oxaloacetate decarboxylase
VARTSALAECTPDEALERIRAYADTGAEALMLVGVQRGRTDIEAVHQSTSLPLCVLNPPPEVRNDPDFLAANGVRILMLGNPIFAVAVKAIYDSLKHLQEGGALEALQDRQASQDLLRTVNRTEEFRQLQREYMPTAL